MATKTTKKNTQNTSCNCEVHVRITEEMHSELDAEMKALGYVSMPHYIRSILAKRNKRSPECFSYDKKFIKGLNVVYKDIRRISSLCNSLVESIKRATLLRDIDGNPVLNETIMERAVTSVEQLARKGYEQADEILAEINRQNCNGDKNPAVLRDDETCS